MCKSPGSEPDYCEGGNTDAEALAAVRALARLLEAHKKELERKLTEDVRKTRRRPPAQPRACKHPARKPRARREVRRG
jgi:hypothetical protein